MQRCCGQHDGMEGKGSKEVSGKGNMFIFSTYEWRNETREKESAS